MRGDQQQWLVGRRIFDFLADVAGKTSRDHIRGSVRSAFGQWHDMILSQPLVIHPTVRTALAVCAFDLLPMSNGQVIHGGVALPSLAPIVVVPYPVSIPLPSLTSLFQHFLVVGAVVRATLRKPLLFRLGVRFSPCLCSLSVLFSERFPVLRLLRLSLVPVAGVIGPLAFSQLPSMGLTEGQRLRSAAILAIRTVARSRVGAWVEGVKRQVVLANRAGLHRVNYTPMINYGGC